MLVDTILHCNDRVWSQNAAPNFVWAIAKTWGSTTAGIYLHVLQAPVLLYFSVQCQDTAVDGLITLPGVIKLTHFGSGKSGNVIKYKMFPCE